MIDAAARIRKHMRVVGSDDGHVGTADRVEGDRIKLTRDGPAAGGENRHVWLGQVAAVEG